MQDQGLKMNMKKTMNVQWTSVHKENVVAMSSEWVNIILT